MVLENPLKNSSLSLLRVDYFGNLGWYVFAPWKFFLILGDSFYTVKTQNLQEFQRIYKGQKSITQGFLEINVTRFAGKDDTFWGSFQTLCSIVIWDRIWAARKKS